MYVGQTRGMVKRRWQAHLRDPRNIKSYIGRALRKHGENEFEFAVIALCENPMQLNHYEDFWIRELNTLHPNGYNLRSGGLQNTVCTEEAKKNQSKAAFRRFERIEERKRQSDAAKKQFGSAEGRLAQSKKTKAYFSNNVVRELLSKKMKELWQLECEREKITKAQKEGWNNPESRQRASDAAKLRHKMSAYDGRKRAVQLSDGRIFESASECARVIGDGQGNVSEVARGNRKSVRGFTVKYLTEGE